MVRNSVRRNRRRSVRNGNPRSRAIDRVQTRTLSHIKNQASVASRLPADPPSLKRSIEMDLVVDWNLAKAASAAVTNPTPERPGLITQTGLTIGLDSTDVFGAIMGRFGFDASVSAIAASWREALDSVSVVKASFWGPAPLSDSAASIDQITLAFPYHGPGYAVSGNGQAATTSDSCGRLTRSRCALTPPVLNWWDPRFATGANAIVLMRLFWSNTGTVPADVSLGLLRVTVRLRFGVSNVAGPANFLLRPGVSRNASEPMDEEGGEVQSAEQTGSNQLRTLGQGLAAVGISEIGSRIAGHVATKTLNRGRRD